MPQHGRYFQPIFMTIYKYIAFYIHIQGMYNVHVHCRQHCRPLRTDIDDEVRKSFLMPVYLICCVPIFNFS